MGDITAEIKRTLPRPNLEELKALRDRNLDEVTFAEKLDIVYKLGIRVYPSEDLRSMKVLCQLNLEQLQSHHPKSRLEMDTISKIQHRQGV